MSLCFFVHEGLLNTDAVPGPSTLESISILPYSAMYTVSKVDIYYDGIKYVHIKTFEPCIKSKNLSG